MNIVRFQTDTQKRWGRLEGDRVIPLEINAPTLADLLERRDQLSNTASLPAVPAADVRFLSPVTPSQIICQGKNYADHMKELGVKPSDKTFNLFFAKASSSLADPVGDLMRPDGVEFLDYELELALVIGTAIDGPIQVTADTLHKYVAGVVMANDVSARDIQVVRGQWFHGKSFRGFCPVGPVLHLLSPGAPLSSLDLELRVNGVVRQKTTTAQMIYQPHETLTEISTFMNLSPGDIVLTGTPGGVALKLPSSALRRTLGLFLSDPAMSRLFLRRQRTNLMYLKHDDIVESTIRSEDRSVDLGTQRLRVRDR